MSACKDMMETDTTTAASTATTSPAVTNTPAHTLEGFHRAAFERALWLLRHQEVTLHAGWALVPDHLMPHVVGPCRLTPG